MNSLASNLEVVIREDQGSSQNRKPLLAHSTQQGSPEWATQRVAAVVELETGQRQHAGITASSLMGRVRATCIPSRSPHLKHDYCRIIRLPPA